MGAPVSWLIVELAAVGVVCVLVVGGPAGAAGAVAPVSSPHVAVASTPAAPGETVTAQLNGWPAGTVTVGVCGNDARRGSEDCALIGDVSIAVRRSGTTLVDLKVVAPPVPCPCVVQATASGSDAVATAPISLLGVPSGPVLVSSAPASARQLDVRGAIETHDSWTGSLAQSLAGPASKTLVITLHNRGRTPIENLRVVADVGRNDTSGAPLATRTVAAVDPGASVTLRVPVSLSAPAFGNYRVSATVYGLATPARFDTKTSNDPWALELLAPIALLGTAQFIRRRERARERALERLPIPA